MYPLRLRLIHTNPITDGKVLEGEWVLAEPKDKLIGERIYLESILNEERYSRKILIWLGSLEVVTVEID